MLECYNPKGVTVLHQVQNICNKSHLQNSFVYEEQKEFIKRRIKKTKNQQKIIMTIINQTSRQICKENNKKRKKIPRGITIRTLNTEKSCIIIATKKRKIIFYYVTNNNIINSYNKKQRNMPEECEIIHNGERGDQWNVLWNVSAVRQILSFSACPCASRSPTVLRTYAGSKRLSFKQRVLICCGISFWFVSALRWEHDRKTILIY